MGDRFRRYLPSRPGAADRPRKMAYRLVASAGAEFWRAAVFFSGSFWAPTRDNVVARLGVRSVFAFMFHPFYVPVVKTAVRALQRNAPRVDDLAWLPVINAFQVFVSRQPLLSLDGVVTPFKAWLAAPRGAPDLGQRRAAAASVLTHPQVVLVGLALAGAAGWAKYFAEG